MRKLTQKQFIEKAIKVHGDKYGYDKVVYIHSKLNIEIYCEKCNKYFTQTPNNHLRGAGCPKCGDENTKLKQSKTTEQFIIDAKKIHKNKYGYDRVEYVNNRIKVEIYCENCNKYFWQPPNDHLTTDGCKTCGIEKRAKNTTKNKKQFIIDAKKKHGNKYGYDKVVYIKSNINVQIYCNTCKKYFNQTPSSHLCGCGCPMCAGTKLKTKEQFIIDARKVHGDKYGYDRVEYVNTDTKVKIYCNTCKKYFWQTPDCHLQNCGCLVCGNNKKSKLKLKTTKQFIIDARKVHGDKYDYDRVEYIDSKTVVEIYCKKHKKYFWQIANVHLSSCGCPICRESKGEKAVRKVLDKYGITYVQEKRFVDCKHKNTLPFDFYLPEINMCIEFQGKQHYEYMSGFTNKIFTLKEQDINFKRQQLHDQTKRTYCKTNQIRLIEIPYWDISNIEQILTTELL